MPDTQIWKAITALRSLLELAPDSPDGPCRLDTCVDWARQEVEFVTYPPVATAPVDECLQQIEIFAEKLTTPTSVPPSTPQVDVPLTGPKYVGVPFPYESGRSSKPDVTDDEILSGPKSLWNTERPWDAINDTLAGLRSVLPQVLAAVEMDPILKKRLAKDCANEAGFLEEDMRGTVGGYLNSDRPIDEKMRSRNNGRLDALAAFLRAVRAMPEVVLKVADVILQRAKATFSGWAFDVRGGSVTHGSVTTSDLPPEAVFFLKVVVEASPNYVELNAIKQRAVVEGVEITTNKVDRLSKQLPKSLRDRVETKRGLGTRLKPTP